MLLSDILLIHGKTTAFFAENPVIHWVIHIIHIFFQSDYSLTEFVNRKHLFCSYHRKHIFPLQFAILLPTEISGFQLQSSTFMQTEIPDSFWNNTLINSFTTCWINYKFSVNLYYFYCFFFWSSNYYHYSNIFNC